MQARIFISAFIKDYNGNKDYIVYHLEIQSTQ